MPEKYPGRSLALVSLLLGHNFRAMIVTQVTLRPQFTTTRSHCGNHRMQPGLGQNPFYMFSDSVTTLSFLIVHMIVWCLQRWSLSLRKVRGRTESQSNWKETYPELSTFKSQGPLAVTPCRGQVRVCKQGHCLIFRNH